MNTSTMSVIARNGSNEDDHQLDDDEVSDQILMSNLIAISENLINDSWIGVDVVPTNNTYTNDTEQRPWWNNWDSIPYPGSGYKQWQVVLLASVLSIIMIMVVVGNLLVCIAILTERSLKTVQNWFIASLAVADLLLGLVIMPFSLAYELMGYWIFGDIWCEVHHALDVLLCTASINNLCLISLDRFWSVTQAVAYLKKRTPSRAKFMITFVWCFSAVVSLPPLIGWRGRDQEGHCLLSEDTGYVLYSSFGSFIGPGIVMVFVYIKIFIAARKRARRNLTKNKQTVSVISSAAAPQASAVKSASTSGAIVTSTGQQSSSSFTASNVNSPTPRVEIEVQSDSEDEEEDEADDEDQNQEMKDDSVRVTLSPSNRDQDGVTSRDSSCDRAADDESDYEQGEMGEGRRGSLPEITIEIPSSKTNGNNSSGPKSVTFSAGTKRGSRGAKTIFFPSEDNSQSPSTSSQQHNAQVHQDGEEEDDQKLAKRVVVTDGSDPLTRTNNKKKANKKGKKKKQQQQQKQQAEEKKEEVDDEDEPSSPITPTTPTIEVTGVAKKRFRIKIRKNSKDQAKDQTKSSFLAPINPFAKKLKGPSPYGSSLSIGDYDNDSEGNYTDHDSSESKKAKNETGAKKIVTTTPAGRVVTISGPSTGPAAVARPSEAERHKRKIAKARERRATFILGLIMISFICAWLPFFTIYLITGVCKDCKDSIPKGLFTFAFWLGYSNSAINPIIYTVFNRDFRKAFNKILFR